MFYLFFLLFILLCLALFFSVYKTGKFKVIAKVFRIGVVAVSILVFSFYFISRSLDGFRENLLTLQVVNKLPLPLDFYVIKLNGSTNSDSKFVTKHLGKIRSNFYRIEYLDMKNSDQLWISGFLGKKNMVYFSQHSIPNKNMEQIIEVKNYINQSAKLSDIAKKEISEVQLENIKTSVWMILDLLLIFLNLGILFRRGKQKNPELIPG